MKPIIFENLRRLMGGGRKKKEKEASFKRSDSFKRISIRKSYLDRGKKKVIPKLEVATQTVSEEEVSRIPEDAVQKVDTSVQVDKVDLNATIKSGKEISCSKYKNSKSSERKSTSRNSSAVAYSHWLQGIKKDESPVPTSYKGSERTIIYVPASDDKPSSPVIRQLSSSPVFRNRNHTSTTHIVHQTNTNLQRKESNDSAVEMFPWGDSTEVKKSPLVRRRSRQSPTPLLPLDLGSEEMCSLSISLGRIWMDAPQVMAPRSLEMPKTTASNPPAPAHHSLDSGLKDLRDDAVVSNRLQKRPTPPVARTLSSTSNNTTSTGLFSSKDSGFSFSISAPKLSDFHANFAPNISKGFFRKKSRPKPKLSVSRDGYFKRTSGALIVESKGSSLRRKSSKKKKSKGKKNKNKEKDNSTIRSDMYQVLVSRPQRMISSLKLDPMIFVPPEKRKAGNQKPFFKDQMQEIRNLNTSTSNNIYSTTRSVDSTDEGLYESLPGDYEYLTDDEEINLESFSMEKPAELENKSSSKSWCDLQESAKIRNISSGYGVVSSYCHNNNDNINNNSSNNETRGAMMGQQCNSPVEAYIKEKRFSVKQERCHQVEVKELKHYDNEEPRRYQKKSDISSRKLEYRQNWKEADDPFLSYRDCHDLQDFSEESLVSGVSDNNSSDAESDGRCVNVYVPPGVSPVPRRRPVRRKKSMGFSHKRGVTYLVKPTVIRAPSTLRRPAKKTGKKSKQSKQSKHRDPESNIHSSHNHHND